MSAMVDMPPADAFEHGTRARYVTGCRCDLCREANNARWRERQRKLSDLASEVTPSGPALPGELLRGGRMVKIRRCPGANGAACVRGGAWLRGPWDVCSACVERATVWDGPVDAAPVRKHLRALSAVGVGYKAVSAASDVACSTLGAILAGTKRTVRAQAARRVLAVDVDAMADNAVVDASEMNAQIAAMRERGFTIRHLAQLLGYTVDGAVLQLGKRPRATAATVARVGRLAQRVERGEVQPSRVIVDAAEERAWLDALIERGVLATWLSQRLGFHVQRGHSPRMKSATREAVRAFKAEVEQLLREGDGLPEDWQWPESSSLRFSQGFGFDGGWLIRGSAKLPKRREASR